ncbi:MAG: hypothetical protein OZ921_19685 [Sorangiineae bacterium]|nr:hypothetical protein [Sorangiineae bacterium]
MRWTMGFMLLIGAGPAACAWPTSEPWPSFGTLDEFVTQAQPVLAARCSNPSCHGNPDRPLSVFAVHRYRLNAADTFLDAPLTREEQELNFARASAFLLEVGDASHSLLLAKPLAARAGGAGHDAVEVFGDREDYDYRRLRGWVEQALAAREAP